MQSLCFLLPPDVLKKLSFFKDIFAKSKTEEMLRITLVFILCLFIKETAHSQISILGSSGYAPSVVGAEFGVLENTNDPDSAGLLTLFIRNNGPQIDSITSVIVTNSNGDTAKNKTWTIWYPIEIAASGSGKNLAAVLIKSLKSPLKEGDSVFVEVNTTKGFTDKKGFLNKSHKLKIVNIIPSQDLQTLYVYFRNDDTVSFNLLDIKLNGKSYQDAWGDLPIIGGENILPNEVKITKLAPNITLNPLTPLFVEVIASRTSLPPVFNLVSFQRLVPAEFTFGTWESSLFDANKEDGRKLLRQLNITSVHGPGNNILMQNAYNDYHMKTVWEPNLNNAVSTVQANSNVDYIDSWSIDDEPDLNGKNIDTQLIKNFNYWLNDNNTPSSVNLAVQKKYQRYGWYSDVVSMDHYTDNGAPNVIPLSWITREGSPREAIEYTEILKHNTEPKRMRSWCQLAVKGTWKFQPNDFINNYQYWAHVMGGAKGIDFFCAKTSTKSEYPIQWNEAKRQVEQTSPIKNLLLYGEPANNIKTRFNGDVDARMLVGENYAVIIVLNDSMDYFPINIITQEWRSEVYQKDFEIEFSLPVNVSTQQIYEQTAFGKIPIQGLTSLGGSRYKIAGGIFKNSRVFVFAPNDITAPQQPQRLVFADISAPNKYTLSWQEPHDNFGVKGYIIKVDGIEVDTVLHPIYDATKAPNLCFNSIFEIIAFDEAGNKSQGKSISSPGFISATAIDVYQQPLDAVVQAGTQAMFTIADSGSIVAGYQWQIRSGNNWVNILDNSIYTGSGTKTLRVNATQNQNQSLYRCLVNTDCNYLVVSDSALLTVQGTVSVHEVPQVHFEVYPNPNTGKFQLKISSQFENIASVRIYDIRGQLLTTKTVSNAIEFIDLSDVSNGLYTIQLVGNSGSTSKRFIKQ